MDLFPNPNSFLCDCLGIVLSGVAWWRMVLTQNLHEAFKCTVERITAPQTVSAFKKMGILNISEFIIAGDNLVPKCPTLSWEGGDPSKMMSYLPADKQHLITRNVPCLRSTILVEEEYDAAGGEVLLDNDVMAGLQLMGS